MDVAFLKLHSAGNDYICVDTEKTPPLEERHLSALAKKICLRRTGVGGEGLFYPAAALRVDSDGAVVVDSFTTEPGRLIHVKEQR